MFKRIKPIHLLLSFCIFLLLIIVAGTAFYLGFQHQSQKILMLQNEKVIREHEYAKSLQTVQTESNRSLTNYVTSCYEYQKLRTAYEELYERFGEGSGLPKYTSPDDARGNEESCYRY